jgi:hypothetical protein
VRQQIQTTARQAEQTAARQAEQTAWDSTDKTKKATLQDFLNRNPNGPHAPDARGLIAGIEKEAEAIASAQRAKEQKDKEQEQTSRALADQQSISKALAEYEAAYNRMDLKTLQAIWNPMPKDSVEKIGAQFRNARAIMFRMMPVGQPIVNGDSATVDCTRTTSFTAKTGERLSPVNDRVRVTLSRASSGWVIRSITAN